MKSETGPNKVGAFQCLACDLTGVMPDCLTWDEGVAMIECPRCGSDDVDCYGPSAPELEDE